MLATWVTYVEQGNTPLLSLPAWVADVGNTLAECRATARTRRILEEETADKAFKRLGVEMRAYQARVANLAQSKSERARS